MTTLLLLGFLLWAGYSLATSVVGVMVLAAVGIAVVRKFLRPNGTRVRRSMRPGKVIPFAQRRG